MATVYLDFTLFLIACLNLICDQILDPQTTITIDPMIFNKLNTALALKLA